MNIKSVTFHRFKKYRDVTLPIKSGVSLVAGGNSSGKTTILQGLAIWKFCRTVLETERGKQSLCAGSANQGVGIGDDEFTPVNVPSIKHLWTNLRTQKENESDGYTLWIKVEWTFSDESKYLKIGLSLVNDRLFIKTLNTNVNQDDDIPRVAYVPSFAGIVDKEPRYSPALIRRYIGQGLPGAVIRNLILDLHLDNEKKRKKEKEKSGSPKLKESFLKKLRHNDPYEHLQSLLQSVFSCGLKVKEYSDVYHTNITIHTFKGEYRNGRFQRIKNYNSRDLMVEGSGFLQWLTVLSLTLDPRIKLVLLDEPDAHLHPALQQELLIELVELSERFSKQILYSTHSSELIKHQDYKTIIDANGSNPNYLNAGERKISILAGIGSEYTPRLADLEKKKKVLFVENESDSRLLDIFSKTLGIQLDDCFVVWPWASGHKERKYFYLEMKKMMPDLKAISLVDRDLESINSVQLNLTDKAYPDNSDNKFYARKWRRRHIEGYLLHPISISRAANVSTEVVTTHVTDNFAIDISRCVVDQSEPEVLLQANAKDILMENNRSIQNRFKITKYDIANSMRKVEIPQDIKSLIQEIHSIFL
jgi:predicted ATPase